MNKLLFLSLLLSSTAATMFGMSPKKAQQPRLVGGRPVVALAQKTISDVLVPSLFVNAANKYGDTPLLEAACNGNTEIVRSLLQAHANVDAASQQGSTLLHFAAYNGRTKSVQSLLQAHANVNAANKYGDTPLHWAVLSGQTETAQSLLQAHANVDAADQPGRTPLHDAVWMDRTETANRLLEWGAQPTDDRARQLLEQHTEWLEKNPSQEVAAYKKGLVPAVEQFVPVTALAQLIAGYVYKNNLDLIIDFNRTLLRTSSYVGQASSAEAAATERNARFAARATPRIKHDVDDEKHSTKK